ncbi:GmrSD restriction endonuclease domain-containing protein [Acinetobacter pittii]|uniref:GmrSD restriction endonuclease domain-containing protein n=1 Tax=Acinetobacter pittii TaxID=48296 RepID=UPI003AA7DF27
MSNFDSTKENLSDILKKIVEGKLQLPDFQRGWVWDDAHIKSLLVSIARSFPVGAVMLLETGGDVKFQVRPVENVELAKKDMEPEELILDGQQRLTSLTQVLKLDKPVKTFDEKGRMIKRHYYIDIEMALSGNLEDAFISVDEEKIIKTNFGRNIKKIINEQGEEIELDFSTTEKECKAFYFPCNQILNPDQWEQTLINLYPEKMANYMKFRQLVIYAFKLYAVPVIRLNKENSKEAVCLVFEKVNTGGVPLSVFELVTATFAAEGYNLRDDWYGHPERNPIGRAKRLSDKESILKLVEPTDYLQAISLLSTLEQRKADISADKTGKFISAVSAKRAAILGMSLNDYEKWSNDVEVGFLLVAKFLRKECFFFTKDLPYRTQLVPLAAILTLLKERWLEPKIYEKLSQWFWCGVLGELYGGAVETRIANDLEDFSNWVLNLDHEIRTIQEASFQAQRLKTLRSRLSAAYKGLNTLVLREGAQDFFWKESIQNLDVEEVALDIHHIFPKKWCEDNGKPSKIYDSILNKTPISYKANRMIGGKAPSKYLNDLQNHKTVLMDDMDMNKILATHFIDPELLRADDFDAFIEARQQQLLKIISKVMGKTFSDDNIV